MGVSANYRTVQRVLATVLWFAIARPKGDGWDAKIVLEHLWGNDRYSVTLWGHVSIVLAMDFGLGKGCTSMDAVTG